MASREFSDARGEPWRVWDVHPESLERRLAEDPILRPAIERRRKLHARLRPSSPRLAEGWLAFESRSERRRLAPIPPGWEELDAEGLRALLARAEPAGKPRRLLE